MSKFQVFWRGSTTYFWSSLFFPSRVRSEVATLYAFVRTADDFVDCQPQDREGFERFERRYRSALEQPVGEPLIDDFVSLMERRGFDPAWVDAFFDAMRSDLEEVDMRSMDELQQYMYGSAEVVGLMMARILELPEQAYESARLLGRAMQLINFVRDLAEDNAFSRKYVPAPMRGDLPDLSESSAREHSDEFARVMRELIAVYRDWREQAREGFSYIPKRCLVPIATASDMYAWTADVIEDDPLVVFERTVKPSKLRVFARVVRNCIVL